MVCEKIISSACYGSDQLPVYWLTPVPELPKNAPRWLARKYLLTGSTELTMSRAKHDERNNFVKTAFNEAAVQSPNIHFVEVDKVICDQDRCYGSIDGMSLYYDEHHLSERGNKLLVDTFRRLFN